LETAGSRIIDSETKHEIKSWPASTAWIDEIPGTDQHRQLNAAAYESDPTESIESRTGAETQAGRFPQTATTAG
jgi:hypothetical protein